MALVLPNLRTLSMAAIPSLFAPRALNWVAPTWQTILELFPPFLLAVPKSKVSHSRKAMRSANKGLKDKHNIVNCQACGSPKLAHHLCPGCYTFLSRMWKSEARSKELGSKGL